jgi:hypothetical protein
MERRDQCLILGLGAVAKHHLALAAPVMANVKRGAQTEYARTHNCHVPYQVFLAELK